jgi:pyruvate-formate lyase-activating enzyme
MSVLAIMLTRRCNMECAHCSVESGPHAGGKGPSDEDLLRAVREGAAAGVEAVIVTGGEPMLREGAAINVIRECRRLGIATRIATNGFWGRTPERAERSLTSLIDAGLSGMTVSYDRFHASFQGPEPVVNIAQAAASLGFAIDVNVTRLADDDEIEPLIAPFAGLPGVRLRFYDVQPVGAARRLPGSTFRSEVEGFCSACGIPALTDDGRVTACNGPSYFLPSGNPLAIGSTGETPLAELLTRHRNDPILETIRTAGPAGLRDTLRKQPGFESYPFRESYAGMCELCHHITSDAAAVAVLRQVLSSPERAAEQIARRRIIEQERLGRTLSRSHANRQGAARTFLAIAIEGMSADQSGRVLGRADFDWRAGAESLIAAGLARPILSRIEDPALDRWAPTLFGDLIRRAAALDEAREMHQRRALGRVARALRDVGAPGIVTGGAAAWSWDATGPQPSRAVGTVEVVVSDAESALTARRACVNGDGAGAVAVRTRIAPREWGLPLESILAVATPLPDDALDGLHRLPPSEALVCGMVGASVGGLRAGLEAAWDAWITLRGKGLDIGRVASLVASLSAPRAFWVPARVLADHAGVPFPLEIFDGAPRDRRQRRLERLAVRRLFRAHAGSPVGEALFRCTWPALASGTRVDFGRRLPNVLTRAARELPVAWREAGAGGMSDAVREARRVVGTWRSGVG